jgi:hypothetical protein
MEVGDFYTIRLVADPAAEPVFAPVLSKTGGTYIIVGGSTRYDEIGELRYISQDAIASYEKIKERIGFKWIDFYVIAVQENRPGLRKEIADHMGLTEHDIIHKESNTYHRLAPYWMALQTGALYALEWFLDHGGVNVDERDWQGQTALMTAAYNNREGVVRVLCEHGANVNLRGYKDMTALSHAVFRKSVNFTIVSTLCRYGADPNVTYPDYQSALDVVIHLEYDTWTNRDLNTLRILCLYGARSRPQNKLKVKWNNKRIQLYYRWESFMVRDVFTRIMASATAPIQRLSEDIIRDHLFPMLG